MADPEIDHGFAYNNQGEVDILLSTFFDSNWEHDDSVEDYVDRILFQLTETIDEQRPKEHWLIVGRTPSSTSPATSSADKALRVTCLVGGHHPKEDFAVRGKEPKDEVQIYTWKDATLRELTDLVKEVAPAARKRDAKLSFAFVYPDKNGRFVVRPVGMTYSFGNGRRIDDAKTLDELSFQIGDYLSVAIL
ncbi:hypothetical protein IEQ34_000760 [Dendrobium chrysotoxum]|uniref:Uncharacterized protein n=1 Tax=Dendrobium chrysotoxum TaxID=161865 RepID=A0AAV7HRC9_DENCH|nr:hypothetical protein IEQ34_000760 [Dendrobium chrysotoxum]